MSTKRRVLVTGGAGFIGTHLSSKLHAQGCEVICLDNFVTGTKHNVVPLLEHAGFKLIRYDVTQPLNFEVDEIYNLACPASPKHYQCDPIKTLKTNVLGAINVLELAARVGAKVLQASTSEVYGDPAVHPQPENYCGNVNPFGPRSCYDEGKRCAETLFREYYYRHEIEIKIARIFNTYGPFMDPADGRVVSNFIVQALKGDDLTIYGDGSQTRSFCYIDDLIEGIIRLMDSEKEFTGPVNLGNPVEFTIQELAEITLELTGSKSHLSFCRLPVDDPKQRCPDIRLASTKLGWTPKTSLEEGLGNTISYFQGMLI